MPDRTTWRGGVQLSTRTANSFLKIALDAGNEIVGRSLPRTPEQISRPEVINELLERKSPAGQPALPRVATARLPGIEFESSNCRNFLVELEFEKAAAQSGLPRTVYVKLPCESLTTRAFANTNTQKLMSELGWEPLSTRRRHHRLNTFYKMENDIGPNYLSLICPPPAASTGR